MHRPEAVVSAEPHCFDCRAALDPERRARRLCASCEALREARTFWSEVPATLQRLTATVGPEFAGWTLADFTFPKTDNSGTDDYLTCRGLEIFRRYLLGQEPVYGIMVVGDVGPGKTSYAAALVRLWMFQGKSVRYLPIRQLFRRIRDTYGGRSEECEGEIVDPLMTTDLLVLDDLGREGDLTAHMRSVFHDIIDERNRFHRPVILTTNLTGDEIEQRYLEALASRFSRYDRIVIDGPDRRRQPT